jgi:2-keto-4-pentenoate hydratase/2-oxohepta-3-ene-1,7-dioic acid hydratase in catechol pathway
MRQDRTVFGTPRNVGIIDLNGAGAFRHYGLELRDYPGLIPSVDTAIALAGDGSLRLRPWQRELHLHAELALIVGADVPRGAGVAAEECLAGYVIGLGIRDTAMEADLKHRAPRDVLLNQHYAYLIDGSRQQGRELVSPDELPSLENLVLTLHVPGRDPVSYPQKHLLFDGPRLLRECNRLMGFCRGDVLCLGPVEAPLVLPPQERLPAGSVIRIEGPPFTPVTVPVEDGRDPEDAAPWPGCAVDFVQRYPHLRD